MKILELLTLLAVMPHPSSDNLRAHVTKFMVDFLLPMGHHRCEFGLSDLTVLGVRRGPSLERLLKGFHGEIFADFEVCPMTPERP